jgi:hypothetical protein
MTIQFTKVKSDANGNSRFVCHFLNLLTPEELARCTAPRVGTSEKYALALHRARKIGGRKFHNKQYGGGIVFQCYGAADITPHIEKLLAAEVAK